MLMVWSLWTPAEPQPLCAVKEQTRADAKGNDMCDCCGGNENATKWAIKERKPHTHMHTRAHTHTHNAGANVTRTLWKFERHAALHSDTQDVLGNIEVHAGAWDQRDGSEEE